jgi:GAF domain-containing protein
VFFFTTPRGSATAVPWIGGAVMAQRSRPSDEDLQAVFARLADALDPHLDVIDTMDLLVHAAVRFTTAVEAGIVLADAGGVLHVVASTSERTADVEEAELGTSQGPCLDSYRTGQVVETPNLDAGRDRWPTFVEVATARGFHSGYAVPLTLRGERLGALNMFFDRTDALTDQDAAVAQALAEFATIGIVQRRALQEHADRAAQLQHALDSRVLIEQAKGALAYQRGVSIDHAFTILRDHARRSSTRIRDVAEQIVTRQLQI